MKARQFLLGLMSFVMMSVLSCASLPMKEHVDYDAEWILMIESLSDPMKRITIRNSDATSTPVIKGNTLHYENVGGKDIDLTITYSASKQVKGALEISSKIANNEQEWMVLSMEGPFLSGIKAAEGDAFIIPMGTGFRLPVKALAAAPEDGKAPAPWGWKAKEGVYVCSKQYPCKDCTMQWGVIQSDKGGFYFASHDDTFSYKYMNAVYNPSTGDARISFRNQLTCFPGETVDVPATTVYAYEGEWYVAADIYREWFLANREILEKPEWVKNNTGWLLAILKQQNDEVIFSYDEIGGILTDVADARGLDVLGLFGRGIGGHDRFYPDYSSDPKLGGEEAFKKGIAEAKARGKRVILYTNGQLLDQNETPQFWPDTGSVITVRMQHGAMKTSKFHKYHDAPARHFGLACHSTQIWRDVMLRLAKHANELGADGLLYDQLAVHGPMYCYHPDHGHPVPAIVYENDRADNMKYVQEEMNKINPEFIVMTEGIADMEMNSIGMFHAYAPGANVPLKEHFMTRFADEGSQQFYTEMYAYTFPENVVTIRMSNPTNNRYILNYGIAFNFRNESELRYAADRAYVEHGKIPVLEDYHNVRGKPHLPYINEAGTLEEADRYYKQVLTFQKKHADMMMTGRFLAGRGVELDCASKEVMAHAFATTDGSKVGVLVWNVSDQPVTYNVAYPGYTATSICAPDKENVNFGDALEAQSLHLVIFEK